MSFFRNSRAFFFVLYYALLLLPTAAFSQAQVFIWAPPNQLPSAPIASLPACNVGNQGLMYIVTDALLPAVLSVVVAGGAVRVAVICNGSNWIVS